LTAGSPAQLLVLALVAASTAILCAAARLRPGAWVTAAARILALLLISSEVAWWAYAAVHRLPLSVALPLHLCDIAPLVAAVALWTRWAPAAEIAYFWGLAGATMALLTPDLAFAPGSFLFTQYVLEHGLTVMAALLLPIGLGLGPRPGALVRGALATAALAVVAGTADALTGGNYMYLRHAPESPTLLSLLGPWPWYILGAAVIALALLALLELPFRLVASRHRDVDLSSARSS
jgi:hypothetical integral membrane protein (TIGR02206 family)